MTGSDVWESRRQEVRDAVRALGQAPSPSRRDRSVTSDLTIDEALVLHSVGWEPVDLVCGAGVFSIPQGSWQWTAPGEITAASYAAASAFEAAARRLEQECSHVGGAGVVGVRVGVSIERHAVSTVLLGSAVAPAGRSGPGGAPFVSDLSGRDFALLLNAGWEPCGLAYGASFVRVPRRGAGTTMRQTSQNVELTNFTEAMYAAREAAMERMQTSALQQRGQGVVAVRVSEGPMEFAGHAIGFSAWGTAVRVSEGGHRYLQPRISLSLDDRVRMFDAAAIRGA
jgi:uncharacterized protein YbjQ (UPF0145 family)